MKIYEVDIEIICGDYGFCERELFVCRNIDEAEKKANKRIKEENSMYPGETYYKLKGITELCCVDGYMIDYKLRKI
jgi:hypothetical protein